MVPSNLMGITSRGDLIIVDPINERILRFAAEQLWPVAGIPSAASAGSRR